MKKHILVVPFAALAFAACSGGDPSEPRPATFEKADSLLASSATTEKSGIVAWELVKRADGSHALGRGMNGEALAEFMTTTQANACPDGGGEVITLTSSLPGPGARATGCGSKVLSDSMDEATREVADLLMADLAAGTPPESASSHLLS